MERIPTDIRAHLREIIDESDVFVDVHKAIRRLAPAPKAREPKPHIHNQTKASRDSEEVDLIDVGQEQQNGEQGSHHASTDGAVDGPLQRKSSTTELGSSPRTTFQVRRHSSTTGPASNLSVPMRGNAPEMRGHLKHLGPSNLASRPRTTRYQTVKIKPGGPTSTEEPPTKPPTPSKPPQDDSKSRSISYGPENGEGSHLLNSAGKEAKDGVQAVQSGYGSITSPPEHMGKEISGGKGVPKEPSPIKSSPSPRRPPGTKRDSSHSTVGSLPDQDRLQESPRAHEVVARSGSITENVIHARGVRKVVLETTSSSEDAEDCKNGAGKSGIAIEDEASIENDRGRSNEGKAAEGGESAAGGKKKRRKRRKPHSKGKTGEDAPLLG